MYERASNKMCQAVRVLVAGCPVRLSTAFPDRDSSWSSSVRPGKCRYSSSNNDMAASFLILISSLPLMILTFDGMYSVLLTLYQIDRKLSKCNSMNVQFGLDKIEEWKFRHFTLLTLLATNVNGIRFRVEAEMCVSSLCTLNIMLKRYGGGGIK